MKKIYLIILSIVLMFMVGSCNTQNEVNSDTYNITTQEVFISEQTSDNIESIETEYYIGNKNSKKFHLSDCYTLPDHKNRVYFNSREEAIDNGFSSCGNCNP